MPVTAWSYSRYATYELCPLKFKFKHIDGIKEDSSPAMERGNRLHKSVAEYVMGGDPDMLDAAVKKHNFPAALIEQARAVPNDMKVVEQQWGFTACWEPTGWFGKDTWFRAVLDLGVLYEDMSADVIDWKTGKKYDTNEDQMELNALALLRRFKPAIAVTSRMVYLDAGVEETAEFRRGDEQALMAKWERKVVPMFSDTIFAPRPNEKCRWCHYAKSKTGLCRYG